MEVTKIYYQNSESIATPLRALTPSHRSLDLTPFDFLRGYVKSNVYANKPKSLNELQNNIRREIGNVPLKCMPEWWKIGLKELNMNDLKIEKLRKLIQKRSKFLNSTDSILIFYMLFAPFLLTI